MFVDVYFFVKVATKFVKTVKTCDLWTVRFKTNIIGGLGFSSTIVFCEYVNAVGWLVLENFNWSWNMDLRKLSHNMPIGCRILISWSITLQSSYFLLVSNQTWFGQIWVLWLPKKGHDIFGDVLHSLNLKLFSCFFSIDTTEGWYQLDPCWPKSI